MVENLTDMMHREWNLTDSDANNVHTNHLLHPHSLSRKSSDHSSNNNSQQHQQSIQSPPLITTTDYSGPSSSAVMRVPQTLFKRRNVDSGYDTDGGIGTAASVSKSHHKNRHGYEYLVSPRLSLKRSLQQSSKQLPVVPLRQNSPYQTHLAVHPSRDGKQHYDDKDEESTSEGDDRRRHILHSRRVRHQSPSTKNHGTHVTHPSTIPRHDAVLATTITGKPFRLIFMRHSERANQALGSDWFSKAFRTNGYKSYDQNLPMVLPKRDFDQAYEFDTPLTGS
jgi:hypothetical protein